MSSIASDTSDYDIGDCDCDDEGYGYKDNGDFVRNDDIHDQDPNGMGAAIPEENMRKMVNIGNMVKMEEKKNLW